MPQQASLKEILYAILIILSIIGIIYFFQWFKKEREMKYRNIENALMHILELDKACSVAAEQIQKAYKEKNTNNRKLWQNAKKQINDKTPIYIKVLDKALENGITGFARVAPDSFETAIYDYFYFSDNKKQQIQNLINTFIAGYIPIRQNINVTISNNDKVIQKVEKKLYADDYTEKYNYIRNKSNYKLECLKF
ncbi:hypothetical protein OQH61_04960 [Helicobacter sp. MIT 21-1697]|uniref:hypothetical protein n=1 Tax=Helicobacter sp. MIT 21-1697 TaxID=2993733 RepID=UPI00224B9893|nr:hypothetical protein [Helicobacter sp. MIT 21-1697]MCX2717082.1 hypothetical protein [Helicobacter sp. MIT 21-1697]